MGTEEVIRPPQLWIRCLRCRLNAPYSALATSVLRLEYMALVWLFASMFAFSTAWAARPPYPGTYTRDAGSVQTRSKTMSVTVNDIKRQQVRRTPFPFMISARTLTWKHSACSSGCTWENNSPCPWETSCCKSVKAVHYEKSPVHPPCCPYVAHFTDFTLVLLQLALAKYTDGRNRLRLGLQSQRNNSAVGH